MKKGGDNIIPFPLQEKYSVEDYDLDATYHVFDVITDELEEMGYDMSYLDLKGKGGQSVINPAHNDMYHSLNSKSEYELVKSGTARNKLMVLNTLDLLFFLIVDGNTPNKI